MTTLTLVVCGFVIGIMVGALLYKFFFTWRVVSSDEARRGLGERVVRKGNVWKYQERYDMAWQQDPWWMPQHRIWGDWWTVDDYRTCEMSAKDLPEALGIVRQRERSIYLTA